MENTKIGWAHHTWNLWRGCAHATLADGSFHPGCEHCYAAAFAPRNPATLGTWGENGQRVLAADVYRNQPFKWDAAAAARGVRERVFPSLMDPFEDWQGLILRQQKVDGEKVMAVQWYGPLKGGGNGVIHSGQMLMMPHELGQPPVFLPGYRHATMNDLRVELFQTIDSTPNLYWLLLTKRPRDIPRMWPRYAYDACLTGDCPHERQSECDAAGGVYSRENVWLITSVSDQPTTDELTPELLKCRDLTPVLGLSIEPLLGPVDLSSVVTAKDVRADVLRGEYTQWCDEGIDHPASEQIFDGGPRLDWIIIGCESSGSRVGRLSIDGKASEDDWLGWAADIVRQCKAAGTACFVKQIPINGKVEHSIERFPVELQVQEFPSRS